MSIVVTGAGSGMGRACVEKLRSRGEEIFAVDIREPQLDGVTAVACDVTDRAAVSGLAGRVAPSGRLSTLVHAAGISPTMADGRRVLEVDLVGTQLVLDAFEPLAATGTAVVCFSSSAAYQIAPYVTPEMEALIADPLAAGFLDRAVEMTGGESGIAYSLAKVGVIRAAARASITWGRKGARVNSLAPGLIDTPMGRQEFEQQPVMKDLLAATPLGRLGTAEEIANVVDFLTSDAASFVNGIDVLVDGGQIQGFKAQQPQ